MRPTRARRVYLVAVFGASAIVGPGGHSADHRLLHSSKSLSHGQLAGPIERIRVPVGLLSATAIVFVYHFAVWRRDRDGNPRGLAEVQSVGVILVTAGEEVYSPDTGPHVLALLPLRRRRRDGSGSGRPDPTLLGRIDGGRPGARTLLDLL